MVGGLDPSVDHRKVTHQLELVSCLRRKGAIDAPGLAGDVPTVSWPEHAAMETGDVVITVEHCHGCHRHRMTTRHDPEVNKVQSSGCRCYSKQLFNDQSMVRTPNGTRIVYSIHVDTHQVLERNN